jgi:CRP-like cAMP-binding protein
MSAVRREPLPPFPDEGRPRSRRRLSVAAQADYLATLPLFADCSKRDLRHLAGRAHVSLHEPGDVIVAEGDVARDAGIVVAGSCVVRQRGREIAELGPGSIVGELGLLLDRPHGATVTATTPLELLVLTQPALREAIDEVPGLGWKLLRTVARRMDENARVG